MVYVEERLENGNDIPYISLDIREDSKYEKLQTCCSHLVPRGKVGELLTFCLLVITVWTTSFVMLGKVAIPSNEKLDVSIQAGTVFALIGLLVLSKLGGWLVSLVRLPDLTGMLLVGILIKNVPYIDFAKYLDDAWASALWSVALTIILLRAGLGLDPTALRKLSGLVARLAFIPGLAEMLVVAIFANLCLGFPWLWGIMLGFLVFAATPAVMVPCLLSLQDRGYGKDEGIATLVIAAASIDDVFSISVFKILLGITMNSSASLVADILQGPLEVLVGIIWGIFWGVVATFLPPVPMDGSKPSTFLRLVIIIGGALMAMFGSGVLHVEGSGALAVLVMGFVAGIGWRSQGWKDDNPVTDGLENLWMVFQPLLFGLIGTEIQIDALDAETVGWGLLVIIVGLMMRIAVSYLAVCGGGLDHKERMFVAVAWLPKATVQAAMGSLALDQARKMFKNGGSDPEGPEYIELGTKILCIAVLEILITAPLGSILIMCTGPRLLKKSRQVEEDGKPSQHEYSYQGYERIH